MKDKIKYTVRVTMSQPVQKQVTVKASNYEDLRRVLTKKMEGKTNGGFHFQILEELPCS